MRFLFPSIWRRPVIHLVSLLHGHSYLISLENVVGFRKLRSFQKTQVNLNGFLEKPDIRMAEFLQRNLVSRVAELFGRPRTMLEMLYFSLYHNFFHKSTGIKFLYNWGRELFHLLAGEA